VVVVLSIQVKHFEAVHMEKAPASQSDLLQLRFDPFHSVFKEFSNAFAFVGSNFEQGLIYNFRVKGLSDWMSSGLYYKFGAA
jgi:hypothetical protein